MSTCETVMVTPDQARILRQTANFELQRPLLDSNVIRLQAEMDAGRFIPGTPIYFAVMPDKALLALNGNHTLEAVARQNGAVELTMIYEPVKTLHEAAAIYSRFDLHRMRSWRDALRAYGAEDLLSSSTVWTSAYAPALGSMLHRFSSPGRHQNENPSLAEVQAFRNRDIRLRLMRESETAAQLYVAAVGGCHGPKTLFKRAMVMGVGIEIMRYQPSTGTEFFSTMAADDGLRAGDPQRAVLRYLRDHHSAGAAARELQARAVMSGWNAFFRGTQVEHVKPASYMEFRLLGTPWNGDFDPIAAYLPELMKAPVPKPAVRKISSKDAKAGKMSIETGVNAKGEPVSIRA